MNVAQDQLLEKIMPQLLTDNRLGKLYRGLTSHYKDYVSNNPMASIETIHGELCDGMYYYLRGLCDQDNIEFINLTQTEIEEAYNVVKIFLASCPLSDPSTPRMFQRKQQPTDFIVIKYHYYHAHYIDELVWDLRFLELSLRITDSSSSETAAMILMVAGLAALIVLAAYAAWYIIKQIVELFDRIAYNEGLFRAGLEFLTLLVTYCLSATLIAIVTTGPFMELALAAGTTSIIPAVLGVMCLTLIATAVEYYAVDAFASYVTSIFNTDALYPSEPERYGLTEEDEVRLRFEKNLDPIKIKCAIVALREEIGDKQASEVDADRNERTQQILDKIRELRRGDLISMSENLTGIGKVAFDFRLPSHPSLQAQRVATATSMGRFFSAPRTGDPVSDNDDIYCDKARTPWTG